MDINKAEWVYKLYSFYTVEDLAKHRAVIMLPYSVMSYRITELYALAIPMFIPSPKFYLNYYDPTIQQFSIGWDRTSTKSPYCHQHLKLEQQMRTNITNKVIHPYSPNIDFLEDSESEMYWLQLADFYEWPHIQYFDDYIHLKKLFMEVDLEKIRDSMQNELALKKRKVMNSWCNVINRIGDDKKLKRW